MTTYLTDSFTGSNGAALNSSNWASLLGTTGATATIQGNQARVNSGSGTGFTGEMGVRYAGTNRADYEWTGKFTINSSTDGGIEIWIRASTTSPDGTGYFLRMTTSGTFAIRKAVSYSYTTLVTSSQTITQGVQYNVKFYCVGTTLKAKIWTGSEPGSYTITTTDSSVAASGYTYAAAIGGSAANFQFDMDDVTLTDGTGNAFTYTASVTSSGVLSRATTKAPFTGTSTATGTFSSKKVVVKIFTAAATATGAFIKVTNKIFTASSTPIGLAKKVTFRTLTGSSTATGFYRKAFVRTFTGSSTATGAASTTFLGRVFGHPGKAIVTAFRAAEAFVRVRRY